jgi:hypothetical protein
MEPPRMQEYFPGGGKCKIFANSQAGKVYYEDLQSRVKRPNETGTNAELIVE